MDRNILWQIEVKVFVTSRKQIEPAEGAQPHGVALLHVHGKRLHLLGRQHRGEILKVLDKGCALVHVRNARSINHSKSQTELLHRDQIQSSSWSRRLRQDVILLPVVQLGIIFVLILLVKKGIDKARLATIS